MSNGEMYMDILQQTMCASCARPKRCMRAFCTDCYFKLPKEQQRALYDRIGFGFAEAYENAKEWLDKNWKGA